MLSLPDRERVAEAIRVAETTTQAEIVVLVAARAGTYRAVVLAAALAAALLVPWPLIALTELAAGRIFLLQLAVALAVLLGVGAGRRRLLLVPAFVRRASARAAAAREFRNRGLVRTRGRTGVLIYVAVQERYAEIVADAAIAEHVGEEVWRETITGLVQALRREAMAEGLVEAVGRIGPILAACAPGRADNPDELSNRVILTL